MTHKYEKISKVITETFGEDYENLDHGNLVHLCYAVLEEFGYEKKMSIHEIYEAHESRMKELSDLYDEMVKKEEQND